MLQGPFHPAPDSSHIALLDVEEPNQTAPSCVWGEGGAWAWLCVVVWLPRLCVCPGETVTVCVALTGRSHPQGLCPAMYSELPACELQPHGSIVDNTKCFVGVSHQCVSLIPPRVTLFCVPAGE